MKATDDERRIRILTLNCWYVPLITKADKRDMKWMSHQRVIRIRALGEALSRSQYDIICLQELWVEESFAYIQSKVRHYAPFSHFFFAGFLGSGLAIFSKWPIVDTSMYPFRLNGRPAAFWRGDWYAGKGVASTLLQHPSGRLVEVFTSHVYLF